MNDRPFVKEIFFPEYQTEAMRSWVYRTISWLIDLKNMNPSRRNSK